ncbi:MAG: tRNA uracil 4-sulfurtransferase ThiI [Gemmatimonadota bacterium]
MAKIEAETASDTLVDGGVDPAAGKERPHLLRLGAEITTKSRRTRGFFQRRLVRNLEDALDSAGVEATVESDWSRIWVRSSAPGVLTPLTRVWGIGSITPVDAVVDADLDAIVAEGHRLYADRVRGRTYGVRARRHGRHSFSSRDVEVRLGAALNPGATVDLDDPEVRVEVDIRADEAFLFTDRVPGAGGLPLGVEGRGLALLSGGYDSAVAAALLLRRGVELDYVFYNLGGDAYERSVLQVAKVLSDEWSFGSRPRLFVLDFTGIVDRIRALVKPSHVQLVLKRLMYRAASRVARNVHAQALVTGEVLGQVSSQTLRNLRALEAAADLPVFRPLIGFDKEEIIARARTLGTASLSARVKEYCAIGEGRPVTAASSASVDREEGRLDPAELEGAVSGARIHELRSLRAGDLREPFIYTDEVGEGAVILDCRSREDYERLHAPGAEHRELWDLLQGFKALDRERTYVLYCQEGTRTGLIAERMQRAGYEAYSFRGGFRGIQMHLADALASDNAP